jgi:hypothetical protein
MFQATIASRNIPLPPSNRPKTNSVLSNNGNQQQQRPAGKYLLQLSVFSRALSETVTGTSTATCAAASEETPEESEEHERRRTKVVMRFFHSSVSRRNQFDKYLVEREEAFEKEQRRLKIEANTALEQRQKEMMNRKESHQQTEVKQEVLEFEDDFDMGDLFGASVKKIETIASDSSNKGSNSYQVGANKVGGSSGVSNTSGALAGQKRKRALNLVFN